MQRRDFFRYLGAATAATALTRSGFFGASMRHQEDSPLRFAASFVELKTPIPRAGESVAKDFQITDDLILPPGFAYDILARWGDHWGTLEFGTNADFTALLPQPDEPGRYWLFVNHEYISALPWLQGFSAAKGRDLPALSAMKQGWTLGGQALPEHQFNLEELRARSTRSDEGLSKDEAQLLLDALSCCQEALNDLGVTILDLELLPSGRMRVVPQGNHRRISGASTINVAASNQPRFSGPAAGWLGRPLGTLSNCSGGVAAWGSFFTCEENFQDYVDDDYGPTGMVRQSRNDFGISSIVKDLGLPRWIRGIGQGAAEGPLDGRHYGWVAEVDAATGRMTKHLALGRFRHENVALAVTLGQPLAAYMGDDRRGGHVWKYVSATAVTDPKSPNCSELFADGELFVANFQADHQGSWIALAPTTKLQRPDPSRCAGSSLMVPNRARNGDLSVGGARQLRTTAEVDEWLADIEGFAKKKFATMTLADLVRPPTDSKFETEDLERLLILMDAYLMANCIGGSPAARPEDLECEFTDDGALNVFIAFTDFSPDRFAGPQLDVFPDAAVETSRRYGGIHHLAETDGKTDAMTFSWGQVLTSGEIHAGGGGFAAPDNLALDPDGSLWFLTDMSSANAEVESREKVPEGSKAFMGIFGNNALWHWDRSKARPRCFAMGPMESELTGPTFYRNETGDTALILSVQHPGEIHGRREPKTDELRQFAIADAAGRITNQKRSVPIGSNFAAGADGVPRAAVCQVYRLPE